LLNERKGGGGLHQRLDCHAVAVAAFTRSTVEVPTLSCRAILRIPWPARAELRFLEFFAANIRNPHTGRAYSRAAADFVAWCEGVGVQSIAAVQPLHVAA
jgi:hypothetical protein